MVNTSSILAIIEFVLPDRCT